MKLSKKFTSLTPLSKFLMIALFILLPIVAFFLGIYYQKQGTTCLSFNPYPYTPSPVPADWKPYSNSTLHYTIKFPSDWRVSPGGINAGFNENGRDYSFRVIGKPRTISDFFDLLPDAQYKIENTIMYGDKHFTRRIYITYGKPFLATLTPDLDYGTFDYLYISLPATNANKYLHLFDQIISTLTFTNLSLP